MMKLALVAAIAALALVAPAAPRAEPGDDAVVEARDALKRRDRNRLAALKAATASHSLAPWVEYWELGNRLAEAQVPEVEAFYTRWKDTYVEDRLRNDWLLELGKRRDWAAFARDFPRFRMNDDREVTCYSLLTRHLAGEDVKVAARSAWLAQKDNDDGCQLLATTLYDAKHLTADDAWQAARLALENNRPRVARFAVALVAPEYARQADALLDNPARYLTGKPANTELALLALMRMASNDADAAAGQLEGAWGRRLSASQLALAWAYAGRQAAFKQQPQAFEHYRQAWKAQRKTGDLPWTDETLAWAVRAALRAPAAEGERWALIQRAIEAMSPTEQKAEAWVYWKARALQARARPGAEGDPDRAAAREQLQTLAGAMSFYGKLAAEDLGASITLPVPPQPLTPTERETALATAGFTRALHLFGLGLVNEARREWNYTRRGLGDRDLLAAAQRACKREAWILCIDTSDRTKNEIDMAQRFPTPFRTEVLAAARQAGIDPAYVYGLIRQESRFLVDARSHAGASGLMQLMPATARWTAKKLGIDYRAEQITDREQNLRLGAGYLRLVLDDFGGSQAMAAAAYNAGPGRPRRWREGGVYEAAAWAESIPFNETRDYVKKVLSNAAYYAALLQGEKPQLKARLGTTIGPRTPSEPAADRDLP
jgi:soluble lytic murein transglycosylase